ncbi:cholesterol esterase [Geranomyces variabilis]|uniref:Cholesterol esterase n=1 Tax=Geranomyces variabilis TaxID=109894 RepID=A0AAD5TLL2_9FUNG|nr:cholesterol esterase [Geranomyces variabilis]
MMALQPPSSAKKNGVHGSTDDGTPRKLALASERLAHFVGDLPPLDVKFAVDSGAVSDIKTPQPLLVDSAYASHELFSFDDEVLPWGDGPFPKDLAVSISPPSFDFRRATVTLEAIEEEEEEEDKDEAEEEDEHAEEVEGWDQKSGNSRYPPLYGCKTADGPSVLNQKEAAAPMSMAARDVDINPAISSYGGVAKRGPANRFRPRSYSQTHQPLPVPSEAEAAARIPYILDAKLLIEYWRYPCESHTVQTLDGYLLTMHRIPNPQHGFTSYSAPTPYARPPVVLWHGLCINSAAFVCSPGGTETNLALFLASEGFDVWLANGRGSMASRKHAHLPSADEIMFHSKYWASCGMDEMAKFDVPAVVNYVLRTTGWSKVGYVGFSQGTAQLFMNLSLSEEMNEKIAVFVGLAPALKPKPVVNVVLNTATRVLGPSILFGLGCWSALPPAEWMRSHVMSYLYARIIHHSIFGLLGWKNDKFPVSWWPAMYTHLYGGGSVRNIVHWFKIMTEQTFTPYDHERAPHALPTPSSSTAPDDRLHKHASGNIRTFAPERIGPCPYPTHHITTPMRLFCGGNDNISVNAHYTTAFGPNAQVSVVQDYEHMDLIWAPDARTRVWDDIVETLTHAMTEVEPRRQSESDRW